MLSWGADSNILNKNGESPLKLEPASNELCDTTLPSDKSNYDVSAKHRKNYEEQPKSNNFEHKDFVPNYLQYPEFNHKVKYSLM